VVVRLRGSSLNYHDFVVLQGMIPTMQYPRVPLSDGAGEVSAVGEDVTRFAEGDRVCSGFFRDWVGGPPEAHHWGSIFGDTLDGCAQQYLAVPQDILVKTPSHLSDREAGTLTCAGVTAWAAIERANLQSGQTVLVQGTGGVSLFGLQFAKARGCRVILTSSSDEKRARAAELGADETINYRDTPNWDVAVRDLTGGRGVDLTIDVGGETTLGPSIAATATGGHVSLVGILGGFGSASVSPTAVFTQQITLHGIAVGSRCDFDAMNRCIEANGIQPVISHDFSLDEIDKGCALMAEGGHFGKIAIAIDTPRS
jgi:NADPH:quinone reductase-like Zn-dependent oxidoreductase